MDANLVPLSPVFPVSNEVRKALDLFERRIPFRLTLNPPNGNDRSGITYVFPHWIAENLDLILKDGDLPHQADAIIQEIGCLLMHGQRGWFDRIWGSILAVLGSDPDGRPTLRCIIGFTEVGGHIVIKSRDFTRSSESHYSYNATELYLQPTCRFSLKPL